MENVEHYSDKEYPVDYDSPREDTFQEAASSSDEEVPEPDNIGPVEEEFVEGNLTNDLPKWILKYQIPRNTSNDLIKDNMVTLKGQNVPELSENSKTSPHRDQVWSRLYLSWDFQWYF